MTEIEIKAHVYDVPVLEARLATFASYQQTVERRDTYYHLHIDGKSFNGKDYLTARLRMELKQTEAGIQTTNYLTYKKKELVQSAAGLALEVNDEKETIVSDPAALEALFFDIGFVTAQKKCKKVRDYGVRTEFGQATLEVCTVEPLGDFLEIEILSEKDDEDTVRRAEAKLKELLAQSGIPESQIEPKYYNQMLREYAAQNGR